MTQTFLTPARISEHTSCVAVGTMCSSLILCYLSLWSLTPFASNSVFNQEEDLSLFT